MKDDAKGNDGESKIKLGRLGGKKKAGISKMIYGLDGVKAQVA